MLYSILKGLVILVIVLLLIPITCLILHEFIEMFRYTIKDLAQDKDNIMSWYILIILILLTIILIITLIMCFF